LRNWSQLEHVRDRLVNASIVGAILAIMLLGPLSGIFSPAPTASSTGPSIHTQAPPPPTNTTKVFVSPSNITGLGIAPNTVVTFNININQTFSLATFQVFLVYDPTVLNALSLSYSSGIFGTVNVFPLYNCVNDIPNGGNSALCPNDPADQAHNEVVLALLDLGGALSNVSGTLFSVNFNVTGKGLSNIHIKRADLAGDFPIVKLNTITSDGYFSNGNCGGQLCAPLQVKLDYTRVPVPVVGRNITFNATIVNPNKDALVAFTWDWGDSGLPTSTATHNATHIYQTPGLLTVSLTVNDTYGITGLGSVVINVGKIWVQLSVDRFTINPSTPVVPGTPVRVDIQISSLYSTINATSNVSVVLDNGEHGNKTLISQSYFLTPSGHANPSTYTLDTSPYRPNVYRIVASIGLQGANSTLHLNDTSTSVATVFLQLIQPMPSNASLSLFQFGGLGLGIIIVLYAVFIVFKRFFRAKPEL
jgi:hypothetical protein